MSDTLHAEGLLGAREGTGGVGGALERTRDWLLDQYLRKWVILGVLIGIVAGLGAILFFAAIDLSIDLFLGRLAGYDPPVPRGEGATIVHDVARPWVLPLVVGLGGLLSGLIVFTLAPEAEGHGTDAAIEAFHERGGRIRSRIPAIKLVASAITIGSGGSAGREGPTAQIAAGFGSWLGTVFRLSPADRRIAVAVGVGAGIGAIFKAPLGGALLSAEILYLRDFELDAIIPGFIASVIGYAIFASWSGWDPVFGNELGYRFAQPSSLGWYATLGLVAGVVGTIYVRAFYGTRDLFHRVPIPPHVKPAIAGVAVGIVAIWFPEVLAMGYGWLQLAIEGDTVTLAARTMLILVALKIVVTSLTIGSGGSGGVFAPGLYVGGMLGGGLWAVLHAQHAPGLPSAPEPFVIVGMGAMFGGIAKAPIAVMLMVAEMTGEFTMIVPAMIAISASYLVTGNTTIYESQVPTRADSPAHRGEYAVPLVQMISVSQAMRTPSIVDTAATVADARALLDTDHREGIVVARDDNLVGVVEASDLAAVSDTTPIEEVMRPPDLVAYRTESLHAVLQRMTRRGLSGLPVVQRERPEVLVGYISLADLARVLDVQVGELASRPEKVRAAANDPLRFVTVEETMSRRFQQFRTDATLADVAAAIATTGGHAALVVDAEDDLAGIVTVPDLERAVAAGEPEDAPIGRLATQRVVVARVGQFVSDALAQPGAEAARQLPVVTEREGKLLPVGLLRRSDVLVAYLRGRERLAATNRERGGDEDNAEVISAELAVERGGYANGRTLIELRLPPETVVTSVERDGRLLVPRGHLRLLTGDRVRLLGARTAVPEALERFARPAE